MEPTIRLSDLSIGYRSGKKHSHVVAQGLDASLFAGEMTCLVGANGAGKSTLLRTLAGSLEPLNGSVFFQGKDVGSFRAKELARYMGVVLTDRIDVAALTVSDLVTMGRMPYTGFWGTVNKKDRQIVVTAMEWVGISSLKDRQVHTLSDGEMQKVLIAKALAQQTPVILLDEPAAFLDYPSKIDLLLLLRKLAAEMHKTILLSIHDLELVLQLADKIWLLDTAGRLETGVPEDLILRGALGQFFREQNFYYDIKKTALKPFLPVCHGAVRLVGHADEPAFLLLQQALHRKGFPVNESDTDLTVEVTNDPACFYRLKCRQEQKGETFSDIASLLLALERQKIT